MKLLDGGVIAHPTLPDALFDDGRCWLRSFPRTHSRYLHGLLFFADWHETVLSADVVGGREVQIAVDRAVDLILRWQWIVMELEDASMAYHDETTAQRLMQICRLLDDHWSAIAHAKRDRLGSLAASTAELLLEDDFYGGVNNHGMFQDLALLRFAAGDSHWLPPQTPLRGLAVSRAVERLVQYFTVAFTADGVHVENSPGYHLMVSRGLLDVIPAVKAVDAKRAEKLVGILEGAERFAVHSIMPDGTIAPLGDTKVVPVGTGRHRTTFSGPAFRFAMSRGKWGTAPRERSVVFSQGGYAIHRTSWDDSAAYVMTFKAAYLANYHHHCDDLALTLFGHGRWLLSEAGPHGYDYQDPLTKYAYSQAAHNVVMIDGKSLPRVDREPGGVSLTDRTHESPQRPPPRRGLRGLFSLGHHFPGGDGGLTDTVEPPLLRVTGQNSRFATAHHERDVRVAEPNGRLQIVVTDTVEHSDGAEHDHELLWHIGPGVDTDLQAQGAQLFVGPTSVLDLTWSGERDVSAGMVPPRTTGRVQAIRFPAFGRHEPGSVIRLSSRGRRLALTTTICAAKTP